MFRVERAKLSATSDSATAGAQLPTISARVCTTCGHGHLGREDSPEPLADVCAHCGAALEDKGRVNNLFRIENVETRVQERISVNDEERQRQGYDLQTTYQFMPGLGGAPDFRRASSCVGETETCQLTYAPAARIWRINKGWRRRKDKAQLGFYIDPITGRWSRQDTPDTEDKPDVQAEEEKRKQLVVPFVEDHRNILILAPSSQLDEGQMATLQAALKRGITQTFQVEESEIVVEALPSPHQRKSLLFYEAAEGGAGVLSHLAQSPSQLAVVARTALEIMHLDLPNDLQHVDTSYLQEQKRPGSELRICEAGCYQCLLSYYNQPDHELINRRDPAVREILLKLAQGLVRNMGCKSVTGDSNVVLGDWLRTLNRLGLSAPEGVTVALQDGCGSADAVYKAARTLVFLRPPTESETSFADDRGFNVIVFPAEPAQWVPVFSANPAVFGTPNERST